MVGTGLYRLHDYHSKLRLLCPVFRCHLNTGKLPNVLIPDLSGIKMVTIDTFVFDAVGF